MEKLGQLHKDAPPHRPLGPDRRRHPAVALARWTSSTPPSGSPASSTAGSSGCCSPRPAGPAQADDRRARRGDQRADQDPRRPGAARTCRRSWPRSTPCSAGSGSGPRRPSSCCRPTGRRSWWSPRRSRTRCARRRTSWSGSTQERMPLAGLVVNRASRAPGGRLSAEQARRRRPSGSSEAGDARADRRAAAAARRPQPRSSRARRGCASGSPRRTRDVPTAVVPALSTDVHDLDGLRLVGELLAQRS